MSTRSSPGTYRSRTVARAPVPPCLRVLVKASCTSRYTVSCTPAGTSGACPWISSVVSSPADRTSAISASSWARSGTGARAAAGSSPGRWRSTPRSRRVSASARRPVADTLRMTSAARSGELADAAAAASLKVTMTVRWWATTSCISRAIRARSAAAASPPSKPPSVSRPARLSSVISAGLADGGECEYRMAVRLGDEIPYRGVLARLEVGARGRGDTKVTLQDGPCLCGRELPDGVVAAVPAAAQPDLPGGARIEHPRHGAVGGDQPPLLAVYDKDHRGG